MRVTKEISFQLSRLSGVPHQCGATEIVGDDVLDTVAIAGQVFHAIDGHIDISVVDVLPCVDNRTIPLPFLRVGIEESYILSVDLRLCSRNYSPCGRR